MKKSRTWILNLSSIVIVITFLSRNIIKLRWILPKRLGLVWPIFKMIQLSAYGGSSIGRKDNLSKTIWSVIDQGTVLFAAALCSGRKSTVNNHFLTPMWVVLFQYFGSWRHAAECYALLWSSINSMGCMQCLHKQNYVFTVYKFPRTFICFKILNT